ncbi:MAG: hypothetical protein JWO44_2293 [Bacteroidetes bacterium]|nr:hypothetical protein [Bacteroidota bacterium]
MKHSVTGILLLFSVLFAGSASSQVAGYMGKRLMIGYANNFFPAITGPTASSYDIGVNTTHCFNLEYTAWKKTNLCLSYQVFKTGLNMNYVFTEYGDNNGSTYTASYRYLPKPDVPMNISAKNIGIGLKFFSSGCLAPVGRYKKFELLLLFSNLSYADNSFQYSRDYGYSVDQPKMASVGTGAYSYKTFALNFSMGRQRVLFDRLVLDYGMQVGFLPAGFFGTLNSELEFSSANSAEIVFRQETNQRLFRYQLFNLHIGLGFLAL